MELPHRVGRRGLTPRRELTRRERGSLPLQGLRARGIELGGVDRKSTRLNSSHGYISYAVFCLKKKTFRTSLSYSFSAPILSRSACSWSQSATSSRRQPSSLPSRVTASLLRFSHHSLCFRNIMS